jgi:hypothetical protein
MFACMSSYPPHPQPPPQLVPQQAVAVCCCWWCCACAWCADAGARRGVCIRCVVLSVPYPTRTYHTAPTPTMAMPCTSQCRCLHKMYVCVCVLHTLSNVRCTLVSSVTLSDARTRAQQQQQVQPVPVTTSYRNSDVNVSVVVLCAALRVYVPAHVTHHAVHSLCTHRPLRRCVRVRNTV